MGAGVVSAVALGGLRAGWTSFTELQGASNKMRSRSSSVGTEDGLVQQYDGDIPSGFDRSVFDDAERSIKYLVLTNTWPKFVRERRSYLATYETAGPSRTNAPDIGVAGRPTMMAMPWAKGMKKGGV